MFFTVIGELFEELVDVAHLGLEFSDFKGLSYIVSLQGAHFCLVRKNAMTVGSSRNKANDNGYKNLKNGPALLSDGLCFI